MDYWSTFPNATVTPTVTPLVLGPWPLTIDHITLNLFKLLIQIAKPKKEVKKEPKKKEEKKKAAEPKVEIPAAEPEPENLSVKEKQAVFEKQTVVEKKAVAEEPAVVEKKAVVEARIEAAAVQTSAAPVPQKKKIVSLFVFYF